jgi:hypothetical protein
MMHPVQSNNFAGISLEYDLDNSERHHQYPQNYRRQNPSQTVPLVPRRSNHAASKKLCHTDAWFSAEPDPLPRTWAIRLVETEVFVRPLPGTTLHANPENMGCDLKLTYWRGLFFGLVWPSARPCDDHMPKALSWYSKKVLDLLTSSPLQDRGSLIPSLPSSVPLLHLTQVMGGKLQHHTRLVEADSCRFFISLITGLLTRGPQSPPNAQFVSFSFFCTLIRISLS